MEMIMYSILYWRRSAKRRYRFSFPTDSFLGSLSSSSHTIVVKLQAFVKSALCGGCPKNRDPETPKIGLWPEVEDRGPHVLGSRGPCFWLPAHKALFTNACTLIYFIFICFGGIYQKFLYQEKKWFREQGDHLERSDVYWSFLRSNSLHFHDMKHQILCNE